MTPRATYRIQFHKDFPFAAAIALVPYLKTLGISHLYSSPILTARAGSVHGYDVVDHTAVNPELGGESEFKRLAAALKGAGIGIIVDIVPNHMAVGAADNRWWLDVLQNGAESDFAHFFDIDFDTDIPNLKGKLLAPFLGAPYEETLASGDLKLIDDKALGTVAVAYHHHRFPIRRRDRKRVASNIDRYRDPKAMHRLLEAQNFVLAWWRTAGDQINWRRFFDVTELAALRIELPDVFEAVHAKIFDLYREGVIDGVRVDHVDGLSDPAGYCRRLRERLDELSRQRDYPSPAYILVEKILGAGEILPPDWRADGTTGYDFMNQVSALLHDPQGEAVLTGFWADISNRPPDFETEELSAREEMLRTGFDHQLRDAAAAFSAHGQSTGTRDLTPQSLERALIHLIRNMRVYRSYATGLPGTPPPGEGFDRAMEKARAEAPAESLALDAICATMASTDAPVAVTRFNQLTAPVAAKAVEDTAFYRYGRILSRNDVGFEPGCFSLTVEAFHAAAIARSRDYPQAMLATATHDHKRGEDVRARLAVLSELAGEWRTVAQKFFALNKRTRPDEMAADDEYQLYQTLVGIWPIDDGAAHDRAFRDRVVAWRIKSLREAKLRSSWAQPNEDYESANIAFIEAILDPTRSSAFLNGLDRFVRRIAPAGMLNSLTQLVLRLTLPGVPDIYQGAELWDLSLVDPDNRRPVDFAARVHASESNTSLTHALQDWTRGDVKLQLVKKLLTIRQALPELFSRGDYRPLSVAGRRLENAIAFARTHGDHELIVALPIRCAAAVAGTRRIMPSATWWGNTRLELSGRTATDVLRYCETTATRKLSLGILAQVPALVFLRRSSSR
jgi:(1->4)-alpha-D-glucan 1-alpha-D-glucosylmutase